MYILLLVDILIEFLSCDSSMPLWLVVDEKRELNSFSSLSSSLLLWNFSGEEKERVRKIAQSSPYALAFR